MRDVYIIGVGTTNCGRFPDKAAHVLGSDAAWKAIKDSGIHPRKIEIAFCGHVYQGMGVGQRTFTLPACGTSSNNKSLILLPPY